jgi:hypothetical protein
VRSRIILGCNIKEENYFAQNEVSIFEETVSYTCNYNTKRQQQHNGMPFFVAKNFIQHVVVVVCVNKRYLLQHILFLFHLLLNEKCQEDDAKQENITNTIFATNITM